MLHVGNLVLGTAQFGLNYGINNSHGKPGREEVFDILEYAYNSGISMLDTAEAYGNALEIIAAYHRKTKGHFKIISKFKYSANTDITQSINKTISDLNIEYLYCYMFHSYLDVINHPELLKRICKMRDDGLVKYIGASIYTNQQLEDVLKKDEIDLLQLPFNLLDNNLQRGRLIEKAKAAGKIVHIRSVFLQGLFFKDFELLAPENVLYPLKQNLRILHNIAQDEQISISALALQYPLHNSSIDGVLFGVDTLAQLQQNLDELKVNIKETVFDEIDRMDVNSRHLLLPINWS
ncbi:MAG TPA: aldo/keto reductase [Mucilaginibacter sp.]|jgi:aryl-alcohol dehydrogenase-like predicted oxidoreductase